MKSLIQRVRLKQGHHKLRWMFCMLLFLKGINYFYSQTLNFENYTTKDGLLSDEVYNMYQDKSGYLWVFSEFGTVKYDGFQFRQVLKNLPFKESFIYCIYENEKGRKWVANSNAKVYEIRNDSAFLFQGIDEITKTLKVRGGEILKLYEDDTLNFYILTKAYCYKLKKTVTGYNIQNLSFAFKADSILYSINDFKSDALVYNNRKSIDGLTFINKGKTRHYIAVSKDAGSYLIPNPFYHADLLNPYDAMRNLKKYNSNYHFAYSNGFWSLNSMNQLSVSRFKTYVINFTKDDVGHFWICCWNDGIYELDENGKILNHYLEGITVSDLLFDHQNGLWASSQGMGLYHCVNVKASRFISPHPLGVSVSVLKILDSVLYVANMNGEVVKIDKAGFQKIRNATNVQVREIEKYNQRLVIADLAGNVKDLATNSKLIDDLGVGYSYTKLFVWGDTIVGVTRQTIGFSCKNKLKRVNFYRKKILCIERHRNKLWIGTDDGVYTTSYTYDSDSKVHNGIIVYDTINKLDRPCHPGELEDINIQSIFKDNEENLWFCSAENGLYCLHENYFLNYTKNTGLPDNIINDVYRIGDIILLSTNSGLYLSIGWSPKTGFAYWERICNGTVFKSVFYNQTIYAVTSHGLIIYDYKNKLSALEKIMINWRTVKINSIEVLPRSFFKIRSEDKNLEFDFDVISFDGTRPLLNYILKGSQNDSLRTGNASYRIAQLAPGDYTLTVYPEMAAKNRPILRIPFYVEPAFWQTLTFKFLVAFLISLLVFLIIWLIMRRNKIREQVRIKNEQLLLEYKLIALKAQVNPHFMSNCLSAIQDMVMGNERDKATYYISEFGLMMRQILEYSSKQTISLREELDLLGIYVELEQLRFDNKFDYKVQIIDDFNPSEIKVPPLILNPIVENAIWHGLLPIRESRQAMLSIDVKIDGESIVMIVEDNGVGWRKDGKTIGNHKTKSYGIQITEQRISNWNYLFNSKEAKIHFENLADLNDGSLGTRVEIRLSKI